MPDESFEDRLRAFADNLARSISDSDLGDVADRLGIDPDRVREVSGAVEGWLQDRGTGGEPLFGERPAGRSDDPRAGDRRAADPRSPSPDPAADPPSPSANPAAAAAGDPAGPVAGPHPLDLPTDPQGRALAALDSGRWTLRPGSGRLIAAGPAPAPSGPAATGDLAGDLRARDWITADGGVTLVGHRALSRWCASAEAGGAGETGDSGDDGSA